MSPSAVCDILDLAQDLRHGVAVTNVGAKKTVKRRTTFSIAPEHMREAQNSFNQSLATALSDKKTFFNDIKTRSDVRRDSGIEINDSDDEVITPPPLRPDTDYTPHEIDAKDYMDKVLRGKIQFPPLRKRDAPHMKELTKKVVDRATRMPADGVLLVKSNMEQVATLALPDEIKT